MKTSFNYKQIARTAGILLAGLLLGWLLFGGTSTDQSTDMEQHISETHTNEQGEVVYTCSMHPSVRQSEPGNCPICGMELIPANQESSAEAAGPYEMQMTEAATRLAQVQTTEVVKKVATQKIRMPGKVVVDERKTASISAQFPGRIEQLYIDFTGQQVSKGEKLASIYSPQLVTAQKELLEAAKRKETNPTLYRAARKKLELWELPKSTINEVEQSGNIQTTVDIVSPVDGVVTDRKVAREDYVNTGSLMYRIANLSTVWVMFDAYESDLAGLRTGDQVSFSVQAYPGETFKAEVTYIDPILDPQSRTANIRAEAENTDGQLKPQMLAEGIISSNVEGGKEQILVPKSAVLWTGERSVVYVQKPNTSQPTFEFREVILGQRVGDQYVVKSGVEPGEEVVTHGNFKIDSAAQLAGKASMMNQNPDGSKPAGHDHGSMEMEGETSKADNTEEPHQHAEHLDTLVKSYLNMKSALANDSFDKAQSQLVDFRVEVTQSAAMNNHPEHSEMHRKHHAAMVEAVNSGSNAKTLKQLRSAFIAISDNLVNAVENQGFDKQELYLQYCPMADNKKGATWISKNKKISNPYMGQRMSTCGSTERTIPQEP